MIRDYHAADEPQWLETRLLSFFHTSYYDDVKVAKTRLPPQSIEIVDAGPTGIRGLLDVEVEGTEATIDTIAVHPGSSRAGIGRALLREARHRLPASVTTLDAWTRDDVGANSWYRAMGFVEKQRYLHVYRSDEAGDPEIGFETPTGMSRPVIAMMHASIDQEAELRARYSRVYICRQYVLGRTATRNHPETPLA